MRSKTTLYRVLLPRFECCSKVNSKYAVFDSEIAWLANNKFPKTFHPFRIESRRDLCCSYRYIPLESPVKSKYYAFSSIFYQGDRNGTALQNFGLVDSFNQKIKLNKSYATSLSKTYLNYFSHFLQPYTTVLKAKK